MALITKKEIMNLKKRRNELQDLVKKQRKAEMIQDKARREEMRLKKEISQLRDQTTQSIRSKIKKIRNSKEFKEGIKSTKLRARKLGRNLKAIGREIQIIYGFKKRRR